MKMNIFLAVFAAAGLFAGSSALAQGATVPFGGLDLGENATVEVTADSLGIDQSSGKAVFSNNVVVGIQNMRLSADKVEVGYNADGGGTISSLLATGHVVFTNGIEAAESDEARFDVVTNTILMSGNVILTQGENALSSQRLRIDLQAGTALLEGRVQTIFQTGSSE